MKILPSKTVRAALADTGSPWAFSATHSTSPSSLFFLTGSILSSEPPSKSEIRYLELFLQ